MGGSPTGKLDGRHPRKLGVASIRARAAQLHLVQQAGSCTYSMLGQRCHHVIHTLLSKWHSRLTANAANVFVLGVVWFTVLSVVLVLWRPMRSSRSWRPCPADKRMCSPMRHRCMHMVDPPWRAKKKS